jgi:hypothetical protein
MAKYLLIAVVVISLATAGLGFVNHGKLVDTLATLDQTKLTLGTAQKTLTTTQTDLKTTKATLEAANSDKTKLAADLTAAQGEASKAKSDLDAATKDVATKAAKITELETQIASIQPANPTEPGQDLKAMVDKLNQTIQEQESQITSLSEKNKADAEKVKTFEEQEKLRQTKQMQKGLEGRVLAVNPAWNFVVLSIGDKQGVVNNAELLLKRSGQYLGKVRITSVEPSTSIADIVANTLPSGVAVQPGDSVIFQAQE